MKNKIFIGILSLVMGLFLVSCSDDDDYAIATQKIISSITTGSADVTANTATMYGTVDGLSGQNSSAYEVGVKYGTSESSLTKSVVGTLTDSLITANLSGLTENKVIYYQAYVTLQGRVTYTGEVKSLITTDAKVATADAAEITNFGATLGGTLTDFPSSGVTCGIVISDKSDQESVRAGLVVPASSVTSTFSLKELGLVTGKTYYYAAYLNLGAGVIYGDVKTLAITKGNLDDKNDFVDMGLSVKWCKYNFGASNEADYGGYYTYGDLTGVMNSTDITDYTIDTDISGTSNDVAYATYGNASIPTADQFAELFALSHTWTTKTNSAGETINGVEFTAKNGNKLFLPAAGSRSGNTVSNVGEQCNYATGSVNSNASKYSISYTFGNGINEHGTSPRFTALSVRPIAADLPVTLAYVGSDWGGNWNAVEKLSPSTLLGTHTATLKGSAKDGMIVYLDVSRLYSYYPEAMVRIDDIKLDGKSIKFDANKFYYGDIEQKGNYRVELFNIYGKGATDGKVKTSPFSNLTNTASEPALAYSSSVEVTYTILSGTGAGTYTPNLITINPSWGGTWGYNAGKSFTVKYENYQYSIESPTMDIKYVPTDGVDYSAGSIMTFVQVADIYKYFPTMHATLNKLALDGKSVSFSSSKVLDANESPNYRLELWNMYGATSKAGCAFGTADNGVIKGLGFKSSMELNVTFHSLFAVPNF